MIDMKICHLTTMYPFPGEGHNGHAVKALVDALMQSAPPGESHEVLSLLPWGLTLGRYMSARNRNRYMVWKNNAGPPEMRFGYRLAVPGERFCGLVERIGQPLAARIWHRDAGADLLHVHTPFNVGLVGTWIRQKRGVPLVTTVRRGARLLDEGTRLVRKNLLEAYAGSDALGAPSPAINRFLNRHGLSADIIPNGTSEIFNEKPESPSVNSNEILFVGSLDENKGIKPLINAVRELCDSGVDFRLQIVGDGVLREFVREQCRQCLQISYAGVKTPLEVRKLMRRAALLCVPSHSETFGVVYIEAMKQGIPVVARKGTGIDGFGKDGIHYKLINEDWELPDVLRVLLADPNMRSRVGAAGQQIAQDMNWQSAAVSYRALYKKVFSTVKPSD